jgi:hypothetical protein
MMEESFFREVEKNFNPYKSFKEIYAIPFNHWKMDNEWMILIIIDGESYMEWLTAASPEEASTLALEKILRDIN